MIKPEDIEVPWWLMESRCGRELMTWREIYAEILAALANNPIVPTEEEVREMVRSFRESLIHGREVYEQHLCTEWQRRMFLRKPSALDALLETAPRVARDAVLAAYELGKKERK